MRDKMLAVFVWPLRLVLAEAVIAIDEFLMLLAISLNRYTRD
jgi:hypothetical protein